MAPNGIGATAKILGSQLLMVRRYKLKMGVNTIYGKSFAQFMKAGIIT